MSAGTLATWIAAVFAVGSAYVSSRGAAEVARRSLAMSVAFAALAAGFLLRALALADHQVAFVARNVLQADAASARVLAIFAEPAGAGLVVAAVVGAVGWWSGRLASNAWRSGVVAAVVLVLLAASLSGAPLALLPFRPADGAMTLPYFVHPAAMVAALALLAQVASATMAFVSALMRLQGEDTAATVVRFQLMALVAAAIQAMAWMVASVASGTSDELLVLVARDGIWLATVLVSALALRIQVHGNASALAGTEASLAALLASIACVLGTGGASSAGVPAIALSSVSLAVLTSAVWRGFPGDARTWTGRVARIGVTLVLGCTLFVLWSPGSSLAPPLRFVRSLGMVTVFSWSLIPWRRWVFVAFGVALVGGLALPMGRGTPFVPFLVGSAAGITGVVLAWRRGQVLRAWLVGALAAASLAAGLGSLRAVTAQARDSGTMLEVPGGRFAHQGVSSYVEQNVTVLALALENASGGAVARAEQREYVDARGAVVSPVFRRPAIFTSPMWMHATWLDAVEGNDRVTVRIAAIPGQWGWVIAAACLLVAIGYLPDRRRAA